MNKTWASTETGVVLFSVTRGSSTGTGDAATGDLGVGVTEVTVFVSSIELVPVDVVMASSAAVSATACK